MSKVINIKLAHKAANKNHIYSFVRARCVRVWFDEILGNTEGNVPVGLFQRKKSVLQQINRFASMQNPNETTERGSEAHEDTVCFVSTVAARTNARRRAHTHGG